MVEYLTTSSGYYGVIGKLPDSYLVAYHASLKLAAVDLRPNPNQYAIHISSGIEMESIIFLISQINIEIA
jgi:hypothetical protein